MAINIPVHTYERDLWIAAFIPVIVYFLIWICGGALEEPSKGQSGTTTIATTAATARETTVTDTTTPPSGAITTRAVTTNGPVPCQGKAYRKAFGVKALNESSHVLLIGFILLVSMAAMSNAFGYTSRSLIALSWSIMTMTLLWSAILLYIRNRLVQLTMTFVIAVLFIAFWSILFHQIRAV